MKKITLFLFLCFSTTLFAQEAFRERDLIPEEQVPKIVIQALENDFPEGFVREWYVNRGLTATDYIPERYMVKFSETGGTTNHFATYLPNGVLFYHSELLMPNNIPSDIFDRTKAEYNKFEVEEAHFITMFNPKREIYKVRLRDQTMIQNAYYTVDGIPIDKNDLPEELLVFKY